MSANDNQYNKYNQYDINKYRFREHAQYEKIGYRFERKFIGYNEFGKKRYFCDEKGFSYYIGAMWVDRITRHHGIQKTTTIIEPKIPNIDFMRMFTICLEHREVMEDFNNIYDIYFDKKYIIYKGTTNLPYIEPLIVGHFLYCLEPLIKSGLKHNFVYREDNLPKIKGKLMFGKHIKHNEMRGLNMRAYCRFSEYDKNCLENRILKKALRLCQKYLNNINQYNLHTKLTNCLAAFSGVNDEVSNFELKRFRINPLYMQYKTALTVAIHIIKLNNYSSGDKRLAPPFWIDMPLLFEKYVYALMLNSNKRNNHNWGKILYQEPFEAGIPDFLLCDKQMVADAKYTEYKNKAINYKHTRQLAGYSRYIPIRKLLGYDESSEALIKCLIIYPNKRASLKNFKPNMSEQSREYKHFYKLGVPLPRLKKNI